MTVPLHDVDRGRAPVQQEYYICVRVSVKDGGTSVGNKSSVASNTRTRVSKSLRKIASQMSDVGGDQGYTKDGHLKGINVKPIDTSVNLLVFCTIQNVM